MIVKVLEYFLGAIGTSAILLVSAYFVFMYFATRQALNV